MNQLILHNPAQAYQVFSRLWIDVKNELIAGNKQLIEVKSCADILSAQQRKYYHGYVLYEVAKQAVIEGRKYPLAVWKEYMRSKFLGEDIETVTNPMTGAERKEVVRVSSESLSVKKYNELIEKVTAYASTDLNVNYAESFDTWIAENER